MLKHMHTCTAAAMKDAARADSERLKLSPLLSVTVTKELELLRQVDDLADILYDEDVVRVSALRYERLWVLAVEASSRQGTSVPAPTIDIAFIWHCHVLCPTRCILWFSWRIVLPLHVGLRSSASSAERR